MSVSLGARIEANHILAGTKFLALHESRYIVVAGASFLSGCVSDPKQLLDEAYTSKAPEEEFSQLYNHCAAMEMAALVFAFSIAESALCDVLAFLFEHDQTSLDPILEKRQVSLAEVAGAALAELKNEVFAKYLSEFEGMGFPIKRKASTLLGILKPTTTADVVPGFVFEADKLDEISKRRNTYVHHADLSHFSAIDEHIEADLDFLGKSVDFFYELLRRRVYPLSANSGTP